MKTRITYLFVFLGGLITVLGGAFIGMYIWEAIISRMGDPDQSLIFWYLPILFIGAIAAIGGLSIFRRGLGQIRRMRKEFPQSGGNDT